MMMFRAILRILIVLVLLRRARRQSRRQGRRRFEELFDLFQLCQGFRRGKELGLVQQRRRSLGRPFRTRIR